ncbi:hypothetical protein [Nocardia wallacei]|uniref:hypothetical protein n=1 Tax=Nocardia wallacei TaxID=480035 RepID=UPI002457284C|nr:hypothetical protein [Nocardia wallacei]
MPTPRESIDLDADEYDPSQYAEAEEYEEEPPRPARARSTANRATRRAATKRAPTRASRVPATAPQPQDHKPPAPPRKARPKPAVQVEAEGIETVEVEYDGEFYVIPADPLDWPRTASKAFERGQANIAIDLILGTKQARKLDRKGYTNRQTNELFELLAEAGGFENMGN